MSSPATRRIRTLLHRLSQVEFFVSLVLLTGIACAVIADVVARELGYGGVRGAASVSTLMMIAMGYLGISLAVAHGSHLEVVNLVVRWRGFESWQQRLGDLLSAALCAFFAWFAIEFVAETHAFNDRTVYLEIPLWIPQIAIPYAFLSSGFRFLAFAILPDLKPSDTLS